APLASDRRRYSSRGSDTSSPLHRRADLPGNELVVAIAQELALGLLAGGDAQDGGEDLRAFLLDGDAVEDVAAVDVHVALHAAVDVVVGGELDRGRGLAAVGRAAARREAEHVAAAGHLAGGRDGVVAGGVHVDEALGGDRLG